MYGGVGQTSSGMTTSPDVGTETLSKVHEDTLVKVPGEIAVPTVTGPVTPSPSYVTAPPAMPMAPPPTFWERLRALPPWALIGGASAVVLTGALLFRSNSP